MATTTHAMVTRSQAAKGKHASSSSSLKTAWGGSTGGHAKSSDSQARKRRQEQQAWDANDSNVQRQKQKQEQPRNIQQQHVYAQNMQGIEQPMTRLASADGTSDLKAKSLSSPFNVVDMDREWGVASVDVHWQMRERENIHRTYNPDAKWLKYRRFLVDWMCEAGDEFGLHISTMHVAVMFLDRILHKVQVERHELQLVAIACILIAAKYEEVEEVVPTLSEMNRHTQWAFSAESIQHMEFEVLRKLDWCLGTFTPLHFASYYMSKGVLFEADTMHGRPLAQKVPKYMKRYVEFFADLCLQDYAFQRFSPSMMAAAIVMASRKALGIQPLWREELSQNTRYIKNDINPCFKAVWGCYRFNFPNASDAASKAAASSSTSEKESPTGVNEMENL